MTKATSIESVKKSQNILQKAFRDNRKTYYEAQKKLNASKKKLSEFNDRYGRILQMMDED